MGVNTPRWYRVTVDGCAPFAPVAPGEFPEPAGSRILARCAAIRDAERRGLAQALRALSPGAIGAHADRDQALVDRLHADPRPVIAWRDVISERDDHTVMSVTLEISIDPVVLGTLLDPPRPERA